MTFAGAFVALAQGMAVGAALIIVFSVLGLVSQSAEASGTTGSIRLYGVLVCAGAVAGAALHLLGFSGAAWGAALLPLFGVFAGMYVGMLLSALTELLDIFPAVSGKFGLKNTVVVMVMALALGKTAGVLAYYGTRLFGGF